MKQLSFTLGVLLLLASFSFTAHAQSTWFIGPTPQKLYGLNSVVFGAGKFVAVGWMNTILTSTDGAKWIGASSATYAEIRLAQVAFGNDRFITVGTRLAPNRLSDGEPPEAVVYSSSDGDSWEASQPFPNLSLRQVRFFNGQFFAYGWTYPDHIEILLASDNGREWKKCEPVNWPNWPAYDMELVAEHDGRLVGLDNTSLTGETYFSNGVGRFTLPVPSRCSPVSLGSGGEMIVALFRCYEEASGDYFAMAATSRDGREWTTNRASGFPIDILPYRASVAYGNQTWVAVGALDRGLIRKPGGIAVRSENGISWQQASIHSHRDNYMLGAAGPDGVIAFEALRTSVDRSVYVSLDGKNWRWELTQSPVPLSDISSVVQGRGLFVAAASTGGNNANDFQIYTSEHGVEWSPKTQAGPGWSQLRYSSEVFLAFAPIRSDFPPCNSRFGYSRDGHTWTTAECVLDDKTSFMDAATDGKVFVAVGLEWNGEAPESHWKLLRSTDGILWNVTHRIPMREECCGNRLIAFGNGRFVSLSHSRSLVSVDGQNWKNVSGPENKGLGDLIFASGKFYAIEYTAKGGLVRLFSSPNGVDWKAHHTGMTGDPFLLSAGPSGLSAFGFRWSDEGPGGSVSEPLILHSPWDVTLQAIGPSLNPGLKLQVTGYEGQQVVLESSASLTSPVWRAISTNTLVKGAAEFLDPSATNAATRYYRAVAR